MSRVCHAWRKVGKINVGAGIIACSRLRDSGESVNWEKEREKKRRGWGETRRRKIWKSDVLEGMNISSRSHSEIVRKLAREIWERSQQIDISTVWQPKSNYLKLAKSGRKSVVKKMLTGSLPSLSRHRPHFSRSRASYFCVPFLIFVPSQLSESLEQATSNRN